MVCKRQVELARLNQIIGSTCQVKDHFATKEGSQLTSTTPDYHARFPLWSWDSSVDSFSHRFTGLLPDVKDMTLPFSSSDIATVFTFLQTLHWQVGEDFSVSYVEHTLHC